LDADYLVDYDTGGLAMRSVQLAWIVDVGGQPDQFLALLSAMLSDYATPATARQAVGRCGNTEFVEFYDTRWPDWLHLYWLQQGTNLVLTVGRGSMEHYLGGFARHVPWEGTLSRVDQELAGGEAGGTPVLRAWYSIKQMRQRWPDVVSMTIVSRLLTAFDLRFADQVLLIGTLKDRQLALHYATLENNRLTLVPWTVPLPAGAPLRALVPADASIFMALHIDWRAAYVRVVNVSDIAAERGEDKGVKTAVQRMAQLYGVNVEGDIVEGLSPLVLVHDSPRHPLHLPATVTVVAAALPEQATRVRSAIDNLVGQASRVLDWRATHRVDPWVTDAGRVERTAVAVSSKWAHLQIRENRDGVNYLQYGLAGPAWTWVDRRLVFSWSPTAAQEVADLVRAAPAARAALDVVPAEKAEPAVPAD